MRHALIYYGPLDENFHALTPHTRSYRLANGSSRSVKTASVDGLVVSVMQDGARHCAVMVDGVKLDVPVEVKRGAHTGYGKDPRGRSFGPSQVTYVEEDEPLLALIQEIEAKNTRPTVRRALAAVVRTHFSLARAVWPQDQPTADPAELDARVAELVRNGIPAEPPPGIPAPKRVTLASSSAYERSPAVKAWVLIYAEGTCEACGSPGPFVANNGALFLEVHHVTPLAESGPDTVENAVALCPNCHRALHHAADSAERRRDLRKRVSRLS